MWITGMRFQGFFKASIISSFILFPIILLLSFSTIIILVLKVKTINAKIPIFLPLKAETKGRIWRLVRDEPRVVKDENKIEEWKTKRRMDSCAIKSGYLLTSVYLSWRLPFLSSTTMILLVVTKRIITGARAVDRKETDKWSTNKKSTHQQLWINNIHNLSSF